jgi:uncharacterized membrane protein
MAAMYAREIPVLDVEALEGGGGAASSRLDSIDLVRGIVMVLMALDHVRDYFNFPGFDPMDVSKTTPEHYLTRWVTHFCAPTFVFLAGTGALLAGTRGKGKARLSWFLLSRGLWLVFLENTAVFISWTFNWWDFHERGGAVIWAIGWSMVALSLLVWLPTSMIAALGVAVIAFHGLFDDVKAETLDRWGWLWVLLHQPSQVAVWIGQWPSDLHLAWRIPQPTDPLGDRPDLLFATPYPVLPWLGVMAAGYGLGSMFLLERSKRRKQLFALGLALVVIFIALRLANRYGDPQPYVQPPERALTVFSEMVLTFEQSKPALQLMAFLNCTKYPPSLLFLLMTLGPAIMALALFDRPIGWLGRPFVVFGRVPLFFYLLHVPLIHGLAVALDYYRFGWSPLKARAFFQMYELPPDQWPLNYGVDLLSVYLIWASVIVFLFPFCYGFMRLKRRYPGGVLSYL